MKFFFSILLIFFSATTFAFNSYQKPSDHIIQKKLTPLQYSVTQKKATEPAFNNAYWNNEDAGIYVDVVTGEPLFSSINKYDSKTGWPSFTEPLDSKNIITVQDYSLLIPRTEVLSKNGQSHLGHVFDDGPAPTFKRYCINSASLEFIPVKDLKKRGYEKYLPLFKRAKEK